MKIACLQFAPQLGDVDQNLNRADAVLNRANLDDVDLMVLPELAFSGYNFKSLQEITPYLEPTAAGITSLWARTTALKYNCVVTVGYPEKVDVTDKWPTSPEYYNSAITVNRDGETIANYRKSFLYYTDESWALEGPDGFYDGYVEELDSNVAMGICMDLNPYKFEAPWSAWEFAYHVLHKEANLVILSMAWITSEDARSYSRSPTEPDMNTLSYWLGRLEPLIRQESQEEIIVVIANRSGTEDDAVYAGTSAVLGIQFGEVKVYGLLGRGERKLLIVDTEQQPKAKLVAEPRAPTTKASRQKIEGTPETETSSRTVESAKAAPKSSHSNSDKPSTQPKGSTLTSLNTSQAPPSIVPLPVSSSSGLRGKNVGLGGASIDAIISRAPSITPIEISSSHSFFGSLPIRADERKELRSDTVSESTRAQDMEKPARPASPKSRNASRSRAAPTPQPALHHHDLINEPDLVGRRTPKPAIDISPSPDPAVKDEKVKEEVKKEVETEGKGGEKKDEGSLRPAEKRSVSPRPSSTVW